MRDGSHIREQIIALFEDLKNKLLKTEQVLSEIDEPWEESADGDSSNNDDPQMELQQLQHNLTVIDKPYFRWQCSYASPRTMVS